VVLSRCCLRISPYLALRAYLAEPEPRERITRVYPAHETRLLRETIFDTDLPPLVEEHPGTAYAFAEGQKVRSDHPAVKANPSAFRRIDPTDALVYDFSAPTERA